MTLSLSHSDSAVHPLMCEHELTGFRACQRLVGWRFLSPGGASCRSRREEGCRVSRARIRQNVDDIHAGACTSSNSTTNHSHTKETEEFIRIGSPLRRRFAAALLPRLFGSNVPGHTTRAQPVGIELATNGIQFYAIANLDKTALYSDRDKDLRRPCGSG